MANGARNESQERSVRAVRPITITDRDTSLRNRREETLCEEEHEDDHRSAIMKKDRRTAVPRICNKVSNTCKFTALHLKLRSIVLQVSDDTTSY